MLPHHIRASWFCIVPVHPVKVQVRKARGRRGTTHKLAKQDLRELTEWVESAGPVDSGITFGADEADRAAEETLRMMDVPRSGTVSRPETASTRDVKCVCCAS